MYLYKGSGSTNGGTDVSSPNGGGRSILFIRFSTWKQFTTINTDDLYPIQHGPTCTYSCGTQAMACVMLVRVTGVGGGYRYLGEGGSAAVVGLNQTKWQSS